MLTETKHLPNMNSDEWFSRNARVEGIDKNGNDAINPGGKYNSHLADGHNTALRVSIEHLPAGAYMYSNAFLGLCEKCVFRNAGCGSKITDPDLYRHYRICKAEGKFRFILRQHRIPRRGLPRIFSFAPDAAGVNNTKADGFDAGHIVASFLGGMDCPFNLTMMDKYHNRSGYYRLMEHYCDMFFSDLEKTKDGIKNYGTGRIEVKLAYGNKDRPMVPSHFFVKIEVHSAIAIENSAEKFRSADGGLSLSIPNPGGNALKLSGYYDIVKKNIKNKRIQFAMEFGA